MKRIELSHPKFSSGLLLFDSYLTELVQPGLFFLILLPETGRWKHKVTSRGLKLGNVASYGTQHSLNDISLIALTPLNAAQCVCYFQNANCPCLDSRRDNLLSDRTFGKISRPPSRLQHLHHNCSLWWSLVSTKCDKIASLFLRGRHLGSLDFSRTSENL